MSGGLFALTHLSSATSTVLKSKVQTEVCHGIPEVPNTDPLEELKKLCFDDIVTLLVRDYCTDTQKLFKATRS